MWPGVRLASEKNGVRQRLVVVLDDVTPTALTQSLRMTSKLLREDEEKCSLVSLFRHRREFNKRHLV